MAYRIRGVIRLDDSGNANLGIASATEFDGKVSEKAITEQTDGSAGDVTGADELLLYDNDTGNLLRVTVDEFVGGSGIGTIVTDFTNLNVTGIATVGAYADISEIRSDSFILLNAAGTQPKLQATSGGEIFLFNGGSAKLQTQPWGVQVNGAARITGGANITGILTAANISVASSVTAADYYGSGANLTDVATSLADLTDVDITTTPPVDGENLVYEQSSGNWVPGVGPAFTVDTNDNVYAEQLIGTSNLTSGSDNMVIGKDAGTNIDTGSNNVIFGNSAGVRISDGGDNVILGTRAANSLSLTSQSDENIVIGARALESAVDAVGNVAIGSSSMSGTSDYSRNVSIGVFSLRGRPGAVSIQDNVAIGIQAAEFAGSNTQDNLIFGPYAGQCIVNAAFNTLIGNQAGQFLESGSNLNLAIGSNAGRDILGECNIAIGRAALAMLSTGPGKGAVNNISIGSYSLLNNCSGNENIAIGLRSGQYLLSGINNVLLGSCAGRSITSGNSNTFFGYQAGDAATTASSNAFFGDQAGRRFVLGRFNTAVGAGAGVNLLSGNYNNLIGSQAGSNLQNANDNNVMGTFSMVNVTTGSYNAIVGNYTGNRLATSSSRNVIIGSTNVNTGTNGIYNDTVFIGYGMEVDATSNQLHIGNTTNRWITGDSSYNVNIPNDLSVGGTLLAADIFGIPIRSESATIIGGNTQQTLTTIDMTTLSKVEFILSIRTIGTGGGEKLIDSAAFYYDGSSITAAVPYASKALNVFFNGDINTNPSDMQIRYAVSGANLSIDLDDNTGGSSVNPQFEWTLTITEAV